MSEPTHTPGPWVVAPSSKPGNGTAWRDIVSLGTPFSPSYVGEAQEQDAALITAAPELLAALEEALVADEWADADWKAKARAAIAKAKGRE